MSKAEILNKVLDMFRDSVITQSVLTLTLLGVSAAIWLQGMPLPDDLRAALMISVGFFFGGKYQQLMSKGVR